ncbi:MAG TPA: SgcJ/EcaC family oxidoreductase [Stackebrandtia sp.]|uniref:SgcJ/EcaC family oxidoreductase n=1 Tax=Stackebrandtia sp. TaxID=2023065 RepID=UPI002D57C58B|nr:SgcJ/EcaC family oxidoreductase [Stackebrandtia sp.]HZE39614.1 SgcJ/EcaC family oxidoreductase [Stackebrandtia sp.]
MSHEVAPLLDALADAWNAGDGTAYGQLFTEDADYVTFFGMHMEGREAIAESHRMLFAGPLKGSRMPRHGSPKVRMLSDDVAFLVAKGGLSTTGADVPDADRGSVISLTAVRGADGWKFASFQNTRVSNPGA